MNSAQLTLYQALAKHQQETASRATGGLLTADPSDIKAFQKFHYNQWTKTIRAWARGDE